MGNHPGHQGHQRPEETLESMQKEKERSDHLKNLEFKRSKSIRRSIAKRLSKRKKKQRDRPDENLPDNTDEPDTGPPDLVVPVPPVKQESKDPKKKALTAEEPQPFPAHVQESFGESSHPKMDKLRQSFRKSLRKKKDGTSKPPSRPESAGSGSSKSHHWQSDEVAVRSGTCCFHVKYLGSVEVFESRGMQVCEEAIKVLKASKRKSVRSVLHVGGDGLRVVDDETRGLIVDQTIEKVSFCAPDKNYERGFSYICRDGTTRRWMCHGFLAIKESGERLSHAVGCAFAICLERKQKRDKECAVTMNFDTSNSSFTRLGSFRQASITERLQDPQILKPSPPKEPVEEKKVENPFAIARPHGTDLMFQRQASFRGLGQLQSNSPFKRQLSLRISELPSTVERRTTNDFNKAGSEVKASVNSSDHFEDLTSLNVSHTNSTLFDSEPLEKQKVVSSFSARQSFGASPLETVPENQPLNQDHVSTIEVSHQFSSLPFEPSPSSVVTTKEETSKAELTSSSLDEILQPQVEAAEDNECTVKQQQPSYDVWELVPGQPQHNNNKATNLSNCDSSSGISSTSSSYVTKHAHQNNNPEANGLNSKWLDEISDLIKEQSESASVLDDPFDADWAALATRSNNDSKNPFKSNENESSGVQKTFELQM